MNKCISLLLRTALSLLPFSMVFGEVNFPSLGEGNSPQRYPGKIIWHDLFTSMPEEMAAFYAGQFGWEAEVQELNGRKVYLMWSGGYPVAGIVERAKVEGDENGGIWIAYASVDSVDTASEAIQAADGQVLVEKGRIPGRGEHAIFRDNQGAIFGVLDSETGDPGEYMPNLGEFFWAQHLSRDSDAAAAFYGAVGNFSVVEDDRFADANLYLLSSGGFARAGLSILSGETPGGKADWIHFIRVDSVKDSINNLSATAAKVLLAPDEAMLDGRLAIIEDPAGALVGLMEAEETTEAEVGQ